MNRLSYRPLAFVFVLMITAVWLNLPNHRGIHIAGINQEVKTQLGLDLVGGTQTLLEADVPSGTEIDPESMRTARIIVENRVNGLGVAEAVVQPAGDRRIIVELPGIEDPDEAVATIKGTALLEFVDFSVLNPEEAFGLIGNFINTDYSLSGAAQELDTLSLDDPTGGELLVPKTQFPAFETVMTGANLQTAYVTTDEIGQYVVGIEFDNAGAEIFANYTRNNIGEILAIVLDKQVISAPQIQTAITDGQAIIQGNFTNEAANNLAVQLRYGALPIPLKVVETRTVGPTLGQDSLQKSLVAGVIGLSIVMLFMALYYRLPGLIADLAIIFYALIIFALFRTIPVTLTLAGIAGLMLSTGSALDANILIFERLKEELRAGKHLRIALDLGWQRAWPSIRDSNIATLITSGILFIFGSSFGATIVKGFALTLMIGVGVSLLSAVLITRTLLNTVLTITQPTDYERWFGT